MGFFDMENLDWLDKEIEKLREKNAKWQEGFNEVCAITFKARELEKTNPLEAIALYESIRDTPYGNFDTLGRLIILYRKTKQKDKELKCIEFKIEDEQHRAYNQKCTLQYKYPEDKEEIQRCYDEEEIYTTPGYGFKIDFHKKTKTLIDRFNKLNLKK